MTEMLERVMEARVAADDANQPHAAWLDLPPDDFARLCREIEAVSSGIGTVPLAQARRLTLWGVTVTKQSPPGELPSVYADPARRKQEEAKLAARVERWREREQEEGRMMAWFYDYRESYPAIEAICGPGPAEVARA